MAAVLYGAVTCKLAAWRQDLHHTASCSEWYLQTDTNQVIFAGDTAMSILCRPEHAVGAVCQDDLAAFATGVLCNNQRLASVEKQTDNESSLGLSMGRDVNGHNLVKQAPVMSSGL